MYEILLSDTASRQLRKLERQHQERMIAALEKIRIRPEAYVTKLVGDPAYKLRVGDYRILLEIDRGRLIILVMQIRHRREVYQNR